MAKIKRDPGPKTDLALIGALYGRTVLATFMTLLVYFSVVMAVTGATTHSAGYRVYNKNPDGTTNPTVVEEHYYADGEDPAAEVTVGENQVYVIFRSSPPFAVELTQDIVCQIIMLIILLSFPYAMMWERGSSDRNAVDFGHAAPDPHRGLRIGLLASMPSFVLLIVLAATLLFPAAKASVLSLFRLANAPFYPAFLRLIPKDGTVTVLGLLGCLIILLSVPLCAAAAYRLGYRRRRLSDILLFRKS